MRRRRRRHGREQGREEGVDDVGRSRRRGETPGGREQRVERLGQVKVADAKVCGMHVPANSKLGLGLYIAHQLQLDERL